jgi:hypothetical protein
MDKFSRCIKVLATLLLCLLFEGLFFKMKAKNICGPLYPRVLGGSTGET